MNTDDLIIEQYKTYSHHKEKFIDRSFMTNKFYNVLIILLFALVFLMNDYAICKIFSAGFVFSCAGIITSILWWINMDSYNFLIKIKMAKTLEEIEKSLPIKPYTIEFTAVKSSSKRKQTFLFTGMQKIFAVLSLLMFVVLAFATFIPTVAAVS